MPNDARDSELAPIVDPRAPRLARVRKRLAIAAGFGAGAATVVGLVHALVLLHAPPPPPRPTPAISIAMPPPLVMTIEKQIEAPPPAAAPEEDLGCSVPTASDLPIGRVIDPADVADDTNTSEDPVRVLAAANAPQIAVLHRGAAWISDDAGRSFSRAFEGHVIENIAVDRYGVVYGQEADKLAVRAKSGRIVWRSLDFMTCDPAARCDRRIAANGAELVGFIDDAVATSTDQGKSWKRILEPEYAWSDRHGELFSWRGSLYQIAHYYDMCGVDDNYLFRLDAKHQISHDIFHNDAGADNPVLHAASDVGTSWTWTEKCWNDEGNFTRCERPMAKRRELLQASTLSPVEGGRTFAVYSGSVIEVCTRGARQIYRAFPLTKIDAVDPAGGILAMKGMTLLRWSPVHGWRKLKTFVDPIKVDGGSD